MKKRYGILLGVGLTLLLCGCEDTKEEAIVPIVSDVKVEESAIAGIVENENVTVEIEENEVEETPLASETTEYIYTVALEESEIYESISVIQEPGMTNQKFEVKLHSGNSIYLEEPAGLYVCSITPIAVKDLNGDGAEEIALICGQIAFYQGMYVIDVKNECFLDFPYVDEGYMPSVEYDVYAVDSEHIRVVSTEFEYDEIVELSYDELYEMNDMSECSEDVQKAFKETFYVEEGTNIGGGSEASQLEWIEHEGKGCLLLAQLLGYGRQNHLGWMETIISWDETGAYHIEKANYVKDRSISIAQAFKEVLLNRRIISCTDKDQYAWLKVVTDFEGLLKDMPYGYEGKNSVVQFTVVDMDGDRIPEIVLGIEDYYGYMILRYREERVLGNVVGIRAMDLLNTKGTFLSTAGVVDGGIEKFYFIGDTMIGNEAARRTGQNEFYMHDMESNEKTWDEMNRLFDESQKVEWYDITVEQIESKILENPLFVELDSEILHKSSERQRYLDSLSYLIELTYDNSKKTDEEYKKDAQAYFDGCVQELYKIYQLCQDKVTGTELEELQKEQQLWMDNFEKRAHIDLEIYKLESLEEMLNSDIRDRYYRYADIILRRVLVLIDLYYDWQFYDSLF